MFLRSHTGLGSTWVRCLSCGVAVWVCLFARAAWTQEPPDHEPVANAASTPLPERFDPREPIDDRLMSRVLETRGTELCQAGQVLSGWQTALDAPRTVRLELPEPRRERLTPAAIYERVEASVLVVGVFYKCSKCPRNHMSTASGFVLTSGGAIVTCRHVLANHAADGIGACVMTRDGRVRPVRAILAVDPVSDLIVLQTDADGLVPVPLGDDPALGTPVTVVSHPANRLFYVTTGVVSRFFLHHGKHGPVRLLNITADFARGSSGAPVFDDAGNVVGVVSSTDSIQYDETSPDKRVFQMVIHNCATSRALRTLAADPNAPATP